MTLYGPVEADLKRICLDFSLPWNGREIPLLHHPQAPDIGCPVLHDLLKQKPEKVTGRFFR